MLGSMKYWTLTQSCSSRTISSMSYILNVSNKRKFWKQSFWFNLSISIIMKKRNKMNEQLKPNKFYLILIKIFKFMCLTACLNNNNLQFLTRSTQLCLENRKTFIQLNPIHVMPFDPTIGKKLLTNCQTVGLFKI